MKKTALVLLLTTAYICAANAQVVRVVPPSSTTNSRAVANMVIPALPANICTAVNNNCLTPGNLGPLALRPDGLNVGTGVRTLTYQGGEKYFYSCITGVAPSNQNEFDPMICPAGSGPVITGYCGNGCGDNGGSN